MSVLLVFFKVISWVYLGFIFFLTALAILIKGAKLKIGDRHPMYIFLAISYLITMAIV